MTETEKRDKYKDEKENRTKLAYLRLPLKLFHLHSLLFVELLALARLLSTELSPFPAKGEKIIKHNRKLDSLGSTVRYEVMKLCTGSV